MFLGLLFASSSFYLFCWFILCCLFGVIVFLLFYVLWCVFLFVFHCFLLWRLWLRGPEHTINNKKKGKRTNIKNTLFFIFVFFFVVFVGLCSVEFLFAVFAFIVCWSPRRGRRPAALENAIHKQGQTKTSRTKQWRWGKQQTHKKQPKLRQQKHTKTMKKQSNRKKSTTNK